MMQFGKQYKYRFKLFTTIKKKKLSHYQAGKRKSKQPNIQTELSKARANLTYSTRCHHVRHCYHSWHD